MRGTHIGLPPRPRDEQNFQSLSEYACAKLLEKYTQWRVIDGATFQISVGKSTFDFRIRDTFIEYHPISLRREFITDGLTNIMSAASKLPRSDKLQIMEAVAKELKAQYAKRRRQTLSAHQSYGSMELVCVHSPEEFINKILRRFAVKEIPSTQEVAREFRSLQKAGKRTGIN